MAFKPPNAYNGLLTFNSAGRSREIGSMRCSKCGADVVEQAVYCHECGQRIESADELSPSGGGYAGEPAAGIDNVALGSAEASVSPEAGPMEQLQTTAESRQNGDEPEKEIWQGGYSSRAMIGAWAFSSAITIGLFVLMIWLRVFVFYRLTFCPRLFSRWNLKTWHNY